MWERVRPLARGRAWDVVAEEFVNGLDDTWPAGLCSREQAAAVGFSLTPSALKERFRVLAKKKPNMGRIRAKAINLLKEAGQIATPPDSMTLWEFFKPSSNVLVNKGSLASKERSLKTQQAAKKKARRTYIPVGERPDFFEPPPSPNKAGAVPEPAAAPRVVLPGLLRGKAAGLEGKAAGGRGGAIPRAFKIGVADLVTEDAVPIRDVPKVLLDAIVMLTKQVPQENELITHSHIGEWLCELASENLLKDWAEFWRVRRKYGKLVVLHVGHDGTRRTDRRLGRHGELMQFRGSYFNPEPEVSRAVFFLISIRFTVGGSAAHTARALVVNLSDAGVYSCLPDPDPCSPFTVAVRQPGVLFDLETDNTASATNVALVISSLTGEACTNWNCPTHIVALDGKTPLLKLTGDAGKDYDARNALNIASKWWYICDKHWEVVLHWWPKFGCGGQPAVAKITTRPLMGKWESQGDGMDIVFTNAAELRRFTLRMAHYATGMTGMGSLKKDCVLLAEWMHDPEIWFHFLVAHDWFFTHIDPTFVSLRSKAIIHPESGCHHGRQMIPRLALNSAVRADAMPLHTAGPARIDAAVKEFFPNAHRHVHLSPDAQPAGIGGWQRFEIPSQDRIKYLNDFATKFTPQLRLNVENHWNPFLQTWKIAGLVTDPEVGAYFARLLVEKLSKGSQLGGVPTALGLPRSPLLSKLDAIVLAHGNEIAACLAAEGLFNSPAKRSEWARLCQPEARLDIDWKRATLPELMPWFESRFFGGGRCNFLLESTFSTFGAHVQDEQGSDLKEAIVNLTLERKDDRQARMAPEMRTEKVSARAKARYAQDSADRASKGQSEELARDSVSRKQLLSRGNQLLARMLSPPAAEARAACPEIGLDAPAFQKRRKAAWDDLFLREASALEGEMRLKRSKGRAKLTSDPFGWVRSLMKKRREASYLETARALVEAEAAANAAAEAARAAADLEIGDVSDEEIEGDSPGAHKQQNKKQKGRK